MEGVVPPFVLVVRETYVLQRLLEEQPAGSGLTLDARIEGVQERVEAVEAAAHVDRVVWEPLVVWSSAPLHPRSYGNGMSAVPTSHLEIERKYDVSPDAALPELHEGAAITRTAKQYEQELEAVYYDTPDLALMSAGTTLRRRTGGDDAGWHLKRPAPKGDREEMRVPLSRATRSVPKPLRAHVRSITRDRPLEPVAQLSTHRTVHRLLGDDDVVLADLCDDVVSAQRVDEHESDGAGDTQTWREWEVELVDGDGDLLGLVAGRLTTAGAVPAVTSSKLARVLGQPGVPRSEQQKPQFGPKSFAGDVVLAYLQAQVTELIDRDPQVRSDRPDAVHKMRVGTRRLRSLLATFRPVLAREQTDPIRDELKWLADDLGAARDAEVMRDRLLAVLAAQPAATVVGPVRRRITREMNETYRTAHAQIVADLDGERYLRLLDSLDTLIDDPPWSGKADQRAEKVLPKRVQKQYTTLRDSVRAIEQASTSQERDHLLHEARKDAKRARYARSE